VVTPPSIASVQSWRYQDNPPTLQIGEEMGRFNMGSTIIVLFGNNKVQWDSEFKANMAVKLGETIGRAMD
jgi:phosphatidylserine decarboxylase